MISWMRGSLGSTSDVEKPVAFTPPLECGFTILWAIEGRIYAKKRIVSSVAET